MEEPKYSDSEQQGKDNKTYNFRYTSTRAKIETKKRGKGRQHKFMPQEKSSDINDTDMCPLCNRLVRTGGECGICCIWFHYRCEGTTKERKVEKYPQETYYICKKTRSKINYKYKLEGSGNSYKKKRKPEHKKRQIQKFAKYS